jgi:germination protein M
MAKKKTSFGVVFWILFSVFVLVLFIANRSTIENVMKNTGFLEVVRNLQPAAGQKPAAEPPAAKPAAGGSREKQSGQPQSEKDLPGPPAAPAAQAPVKPEQIQPAPSGSAEVKRQERISTVYFMKSAPDGAITLQPAKRRVVYDKNPLSATIEKLLEGPTREEQKQGLINLMPRGSKLLGASVKEGLVELDFNEAFRFNDLGREGSFLQLKQLVWSVTEFPSVRSVKILLEGKKVDYLGPEGLALSGTLTRESFSIE